MKHRLSYLFILIISLLYSCSQTPKNTPVPIHEGKMLERWILFGENTYLDKWYVYSNVDTETSSYIVYIKTVLSKESRKRRKKDYKFIPYSEKLTYLINTSLTKVKLSRLQVLDSLAKNNYIYDTSQEQWGHFIANTTTYDVAPIAEMLYKESLRNTRIHTSIDPNWGSGDWILFDKVPGRDRYYKSDIQETDSTYLIWCYTQYLPSSEENGLLLSAYKSSEKNVKYLTYGSVFKYELSKTQEKNRMIESYFVDKFGDPIWKDESVSECTFDKEYDQRLHSILQKTDIE